MNPQETLGNGCVCASGCDSCDRLAEAWSAMVEALTAAVKYDGLIMGRAFQKRVIDRGNVTTADGEDLDAAYAAWISKSRAALTLGRRVTYRGQDQTREEVKP